MGFRSLFVGIDRHVSDGVQELTCATRDATALAALFADTLGGDTLLLVDQQATRGAIAAAIGDLATCAADDTVVIGFSGHGSEDHRLVAHDTDLDNLSETSLALDELQEMFSSIPARRLLLVLDCCFAGGIGSKVLRLDARSRDPRSAEARLAQLAGEGRIILTASAADEPAYEHSRFRHGLLTHHLIEGLTGIDGAGEGGRVPTLRLLSQVAERVVASSAAMGRPQTPTIRGAFDGDAAWPVFVRGPRWAEAFPEHAPARVTESLESLIGAGFPEAVVDAWATAIPSLNALQVSAINDYGLLGGDHLVVSAPTSSGKTMIGELAGLRAVLDRRRAIFLLPLKALVADKRRHFERTYGSFGIRTVEATGETDDVSPIILGKYDVALLTYEKFAAIALAFPHVFAQAGVIVVDEAQMIADEGRGASLEFLLTLIRMGRRRGIEPQLIALSAVIGDTNGLEDWIGGKLLRRNERPVPLDEGLLLHSGDFRYINSATGSEQTARGAVSRIHHKGSSQDWVIPLVRRLVGEGQQVIVFRETKGEARGCAKYLADTLALPCADEALRRLPAFDPSQASQALRASLKGGVAFHHADLTAEERRVVEEEFRREGSGLRVIAATTTLAMGVNTPANSVVICGLEHPGPTPYSVAEYKNLAGRAGRLGYAERGASYLLALSPREEHDLWRRYVTAEPEDLRSRFLDRDTDPRTLIVRIIASAARAGSGVSRAQVVDFLEASFGAFQQARLRDGWRWDQHAIEGALQDLERHGLFETRGDEHLWLSDLGRIAGEGGCEVVSVLRLVEALRGLSVDQVTDPALITAAQVTAELDAVHFPMNKKSVLGHHKEPQAWTGALERQGVPRTVMSALQRNAGESHHPTLRAKKAVAALMFVSGRPIAEIEQSLTQFGGGFNGAAGPIRSVSGRTCDLLPTASRVAEIVVPGLDLGNRVERLLIRLTLGVPGVAVDLARQAGSNLTRGEYCELASLGLADPAVLEDAPDEQLLAALDGDRERVDIARSAATRAIAVAASAALAGPELLPNYVP